MLAPTPDAAFSRLRRDLVRRRVASLDPRLRLELVAIAFLLGAFVFWQLRLRFAGIALHRGRWAVALDLAGLLLALDVLGAVIAGLAHARRLRHGGGPGLAWAGLPAPAELIARQLAWESRAWALLPALAGVPALIAALGLAPASWLPTAAAAAILVLLEATRIACAVALRLAPRSPRAAPGTPHVLAVLAEVPPRPSHRRLPAPVWQRSSAWRALFLKDARLLLRDRVARTRLAMSLLLALSSLATWVLLRDPGAAHVIAFGLALVAAASFGELILALSGTDPFAALRVLPVRGFDVWRARATWAALAWALLLALQTASALRLAPGPMHYLLTLLAFTLAAVLILAVHYSVTLYPHAEQAARLYGLSLGLAVIGSLLIPLLGWLVLLSAVIHATRRLPRWWQLEEWA